MRSVQTLVMSALVFVLASSAYANGQHWGRITANPYAGGVQQPLNPYKTYELRDQEGNFRGKVNGNPYDPDSVSNPYGRYGSKYSPDSINNPYGAGNPYRYDSPTNPYGSGWNVYED
jgi:hypothetical protein